MGLYESVIIVRQEATVQQVESLADFLGNLIEENSGKVSKRENWGLRSLAFKIKKNRKGHYVLLNIEAQSAAIHEMERQMRLNEDILRYLTLRIDEFEEGPSIPAQIRMRTEQSVNDYDSKSPKDQTGPNEDDEKSEDSVTKNATENESLSKVGE